MTYRKDCTLPEELLEQIAQEGFDVLPKLIQTVINTAMKIEREKHLGVGPYERGQERNGHANGFKPKTVNTRVGKTANRNVELDVSFRAVLVIYKSSKSSLSTISLKPG